MGRERIVGPKFKGDPRPALLRHPGNWAPGCDQIRIICEEQSGTSFCLDGHGVGVMGVSAMPEHAGEQ